jgi:hypothetical protein
MHEGAAAHFSRAVPICTYHDQWIGRQGPAAWTLHLLDLNHLEVYVWGHLKPFVYAAPKDNEEAFHHRIMDACQVIRI